MEESTKPPDRFVQELMDESRERAERLADRYYSDEYFDRLGGPEATVAAEFPAFAWKEFYFGLLPPVRQIDLIYRRGDPYYDDRDLIVGLGTQIRDEIKHARIFSNLAAGFGIDADMATWDAPNHPEGYYDALVEAGYAGADHEEPHHVAAGFQCSTEIGAAFQIRNLADYLDAEYPNVANSLRDVVADEGDHTHAGRLVAKRFATSDDYGTMRELSNAKFDSIEAGMRLAFENAGEA
ncbi:hypothetical protein [Salinigranum salinum]|uniref:hypothetical protein n=1 Tax=Salinigranum salinum TaxID=1364937 RepID=UPI001260E55E|nr:hypothetical protein [Salinigranum salinum]